MPNVIFPGGSKTSLSDHATNGSYDDLDVKPIVVQKFGGTSVGTGKKMLQIVEIVRSFTESYAPVVVVSALSAQVKTEGTTTRLLNAAQKAVDGDRNECRMLLNAVKTTHLIAVHEAMGDCANSMKIQNEISEDLDKLNSFMEAIMVIGELSSRSLDVIMGMGEILSAKIMCAVLNSKNIPAAYVNLENLLPRDLKEDDQNLYNVIKEKMGEAVQSHVRNCVPVVTGYFGSVPGGMLNTVGRGYTDLTAALIAADLQACELQLWKEVDGVFTADPRKVKSAKLLSLIAPEEAAELSWFGSEVIHPFTMEHVVRANVPIRIKNTFKPSAPGTLIRPTSSNASSPTLDGDGLQHTVGAGTHIPAAAAVTLKSDVTVINIKSVKRQSAAQFSGRVFAALDTAGVEVSMVSTATTSVSLACVDSDNINEAVKSLAKMGEVHVHPGMAILTVVGKNMRNKPGISGCIFGTLASIGVNIEMISQGASEINVSCLISQKNAVRALEAVHDALILNNKDHGSFVVNGVAC
eukprot:CFRG3833T1